jgi:riboflavin transporter FmnP
MKNKNLGKLVKVSLLSAMAFLLMFFEFPLPLFPDFLKVDLSDIPALLGALSMGPLAGVAIELVKNVLHLFISKTVGVGELANFIVGATFVFTAGLIYRRSRTRKTALIGLAVGVVAMGIAASLANYYVLLPLYETVLHFPISAIVAATSKVNGAVVNINTFIVYSILPFNIIKGVIASIITFLMYKKVSPILHK